jgi:hypothetical protein
MGRECSTDGRDENAYNILNRKPEGKITLGRTRHRWKDAIRMNLGEMVLKNVYRFLSAQDRGSDGFI